MQSVLFLDETDDALREFEYKLKLGYDLQREYFYDGKAQSHALSSKIFISI